MSEGANDDAVGRVPAMTVPYAVVVVRLERIAGDSKLLTRATVRVGDGALETQGPLTLEITDLTAALSPLLESVGARLLSDNESTGHS